MKIRLILVLTFFSLGLQAIDYLKVNVKYEKVSDGTDYFKVEVKNMTDTVLVFFNRSEYIGDEYYVPKNCYFVVDYVEKNGTQATTSPIPLFLENKRIIPLEPHQSINNEYWAKAIEGIFDFTSIFPPRYKLAVLSKVRFRLTKLDFAVIGSFNSQQNVEYISDWIIIN